MMLFRPSLRGSNKEQMQEALVQFTAQGGGLVLENEFWIFFEDFIGAKEFIKLEEQPKEIEFHKLGTISRDKK